jgi:hypothetical protein
MLCSGSFIKTSRDSLAYPLGSVRDLTRPGKASDLACTGQERSVPGKFSCNAGTPAMQLQQAAAGPKNSQGPIMQSPYEILHFGQKRKDISHG